MEESDEVVDGELLVLQRRGPEQVLVDDLVEVEQVVRVEGVGGDHTDGHLEGQGRELHLF